MYGGNRSSVLWFLHRYFLVSMAVSGAYCKRSLYVIHSIVMSSFLFVTQNDEKIFLILKGREVLLHGKTCDSGRR